MISKENDGRQMNDSKHSKNKSDKVSSRSKKKRLERRLQSGKRRKRKKSLRSGDRRLRRPEKENDNCKCSSKI